MAIKILGFAIIFLVSANISIAQEPAVIVSALEGEVEFKSPDRDTFTPILKGQTLNPKDIIRTSANAHCDLAIEGSILRLQENSQLDIESLTKLNLHKGQVLVKILGLPKDSEFKLCTPCVTAGVRGTSFSAKVLDDDATTYVSTLEDSVDIEPINEPTKSISSYKFQQIEVSPWQKARLSASGSGILSEKILGKEFVQKAKSDIYIRASAAAKVGGPEDEAKAIDLARKEAIKSIYRKIIVIKISGEEDVQDIIKDNPQVLSKLYELITNAYFADTRYEADTITVTIEISLEDIGKIIGKEITTVAKSCFKISEEDYSKEFGTLARVTTQRAAIVDGYRRLAEKIYKVVIDSNTTLEDFAVKDDTIRTSVSGIVKGARVISSDYYSDGSIMVRLEIDGSSVVTVLSPQAGNIFGLNYLSAPGPIDIESYQDYLEVRELTIPR